jgi:hypothetical protein
VAFYVSVEPYDVAAGGEEAVFELEPAAVAGAVAPTVAAAPTTQAVAAATQAAPTQPAAQPQQTPPPTTATASTTTVSVATAPPTTVQGLPVSVTVVGDSQAHSLAVNLPSGIESTFDVDDGSIDGCSVYDSGNIVTARPGFSNTFGICEGWVSRWAEAAEEHDVALVVLGAWDVFDLEIGGTLIPFGTPEFDAMFMSNTLRGIQAMTATGAKVVLLEVACMRPQDVDGAAVPALPERGDDGRVAHVNDLLRQTAAYLPDKVSFVEGPDEWCDDPLISTDLGYRWDGVHVHRPGANLIFETIAPHLLAIAE